MSRYALVFNVRAGGLNSGPHVCTASISPFCCLQSHISQLEVFRSCLWTLYSWIDSEILDNWTFLPFCNDSGLQRFMLETMSYNWLNLSNIISFMGMECVYALRGKCQTPWNWSFRWFWTTQYGFWEQNLSPMEDQQALLTTELSSSSNIIVNQYFPPPYIKNVLLHLILSRELLIEFCFLNISDIALNNAYVSGDCSILMAVNICTARIFVTKQSIVRLSGKLHINF